MKILTNKTYSKLLSEIEELKKEKIDNEKHQSYLENRLYDLERKKNKLENTIHDFKKEYTSFVTETKMNFSIKRAIVGKRGVGKTTFIKTILEKTPNYFIIDLSCEYDEVGDDKKFVPDRGLELKELEEKVKEVVLKNKDKTLIIEDSQLIPNFINWFILNSRDCNFIITSQSKKRIQNYINDIDFIYDFGTLDEFDVKPNENKVMIIKRQDQSKSNGNYCVLSKNTENALFGLAAFSIFLLGFAAITRRL